MSFDVPQRAITGRAQGWKIRLGRAVTYMELSYFCVATVVSMRKHRGPAFSGVFPALYGRDRQNVCAVRQRQGASGSNHTASPQTREAIVGKITGKVTGKVTGKIAGKIKRYAKNLNHLTLPEIKDFNALSDA